MQRIEGLSRGNEIGGVGGQQRTEREKPPQTHIIIGVCHMSIEGEKEKDIPIIHQYESNLAENFAAIVGSEGALVIAPRLEQSAFGIAQTMLDEEPNNIDARRILACREWSQE